MRNVQLEMCVGSLLTLFCDFKYVGRSWPFDRGLQLLVFILFALGQTRLIGTYLVFELLALILVITDCDHLP